MSVGLPSWLLKLRHLNPEGWLQYITAVISEASWGRFATLSASDRSFMIKVTYGGASGAKT